MKEAEHHHLEARWVITLMHISSVLGKHDAAVVFLSLNNLWF